MTPERKKKLKAEIKETITDLVGGVRLVKAMMDTEDVEYGDLLLDVIHEEIEKFRSKTAVPEGIRKAMLSQPMGGKSEEEILQTREKAMAALQEKGYFVVNTLFTDEWYSKDAMEKRGVEQIPLCFLAKSLENMSLCHAAYFCKGWENARGCRIEHEAAPRLMGWKSSTKNKEGLYMTFKGKVLKALRECPLAIDMGNEYNRRELIAAVESIPEEEHENVPCAAPNYEAMYHEAMEKLQKAERTREDMHNEIRQLRYVNSHLTGFAKAVELIFQKDCDCHGRG